MFYNNVRKAKHANRDEKYIEEEKDETSYSIYRVFV